MPSLEAPHLRVLPQGNVDRWWIPLWDRRGPGSRCASADGGAHVEGGDNRGVGAAGRDRRVIRQTAGGRRSGAFSLIEMLIVVSVITLLLAMLLPTLHSARQRARAVVCSANTSAIGRAAAAYAAESKGWLCGSPGTSGSVMYTDPRPDPADEDIDVGPTQIWDYAGALAPVYMNISLPANRAERMNQVITGVFSCPSNRYFAEPYPEPTGTFARRPMTSYNTFRNFLLWPRTMVGWDPTRLWGPRAPFPEASFDTIGGETLIPRNYRPRMDRIVNPAGKAYIADGNRFTDESGTITYDLEWDAEAGGAFCNGGPTLREWDWGAGSDRERFVLSSYHYDRALGRYGYRHGAAGERGLVVNFFDGHSEVLSESQSRDPDFWWPRGTAIPFPEFNEPTRLRVLPRVDADGRYHVRR